VRWDEMAHMEETRNICTLVENLRGKKYHLGDLGLDTRRLFIYV
jgi:hypothetical protein